MTKNQTQQLKTQESPKMSVRALYGTLCLLPYRKIIIKKIDSGFKHNIGFELDKQKDEKQKQFLLNWKKESKNSRLKFCREILDDEGFSAGMSYGWQESDRIKQKIKKKVDKFNPFKKTKKDDETKEK